MDKVSNKGDIQVNLVRQKRQTVMFRTVFFLIFALTDIKLTGGTL